MQVILNYSKQNTINKKNQTAKLNGYAIRNATTLVPVIAKAPHIPPITIGRITLQSIPSLSDGL